MPLVGPQQPATDAPTEAEDTATPDLLPGVDLVTEEVDPGVFHVVSDGVRGLSWIPDSDSYCEALCAGVLAAPDVSVWLRLDAWRSISREDRGRR
jgi:hypothetical protein